MKIVDLTPAYFEYLKNGDLSIYEKTYPALFNHYFTYWGDRDSFAKLLTKEEVIARKELLCKILPIIEEKLFSCGLNTEKIIIALLVTQGWTNGHAMIDADNTIVWLPLEGYETEEQVKIFVTHEIVHALHYAYSPEWFYSSRDEKENMFRMLATEGLATYLTKKILQCTDEEALWSDYLTREDIDQWMKHCKENEKQIARYVLDNLRSSTASALFYSGDITKPFHNREGYYLGLRIWEILFSNVSASVLLNKTKEDIRSQFTSALDRFAAY